MEKNKNISEVLQITRLPNQDQLSSSIPVVDLMS
jgi:hypothetical protein